MGTPTITDRRRASSLRKKLAAGESIDEGAAQWLASYEAQHPGSAGPDWGATQAKKSRVTYTEEHDETAAVGTGASASAALAHAAVAREEGRRLDSIVDRGIRALEAAVNTYEKITMAMLRERQQDAIVQRSLLESVRTHFLARAEAEGDLLRAQAEADAAQAAAENQTGGRDGPERALVEALLRQGFSTGKTNGHAKKPPRQSTSEDSGLPEDPFE
jgi:hypothetical protein